MVRIKEAWNVCSELFDGAWLAERGVRFIQLYHRGWDQHNDLPRDLALQCEGTDQASAALVTDLKQRGLLDDTLVVWGGDSGVRYIARAFDG